MIIGILFIMFLSFSAWKMKTLSMSGMIGAIIIGSSVFIGFSWEGLLILGSFFVSSSMLSKIKTKRKSTLVDILKKHDQRDIIQVLANGGIPAVIAIGVLVNAEDFIQYAVLFSISLAAANSDTWASEIGTLSKQKPRLLLTLKKVERGTSGAVSLLGTVAALVGSCFISIIAGLLLHLTLIDILLVAFFGFLGNIFDTLLGQTVQLKYKCSVCHRLTENKVHCEQQGIKLHSHSFLDNDAVNLLSIALTTILAFLFL